MMKRIFKYAAISTICILLFGCSTFTVTKRLDLSPFANSMISVAGEIQYSLLQHQSPRLRARLTPGPATQKFHIRKEKMRNVIKSIISYSIQIVTLGESNISDK